VPVTRARHRQYPFDISDFALVYCVAAWGVSLMFYLGTIVPPLTLLPGVGSRFHYLTGDIALRYMGQCESCCSCMLTHEKANCRSSPFLGPSETMFSWNYEASMVNIDDSRCSLSYPGNSAHCGCFRREEDVPVIDQGPCQRLFKDPVYNRYIVDGIEFNRTKSHNVEAASAAFLSMALLALALGVLAFTNRCHGYSSFRRKPSHIHPDPDRRGLAGQRAFNDAVGGPLQDQEDGVEKARAAALAAEGKSPTDKGSLAATNAATARLMAGGAHRQAMDWHAFAVKYFRALMPKPLRREPVRSCAPAKSRGPAPNLVRVQGARAAGGGGPGQGAFAAEGSGPGDRASATTAAEEYNKGAWEVALTHGVGPKRMRPVGEEEGEVGGEEEEEEEEGGRGGLQGSARRGLPAPEAGGRSAQRTATRRSASGSALRIASAPRLTSAAPPAAPRSLRQMVTTTRSWCARSHRKPPHTRRR
jgi:hypothetical protein